MGHHSFVIPGETPYREPEAPERRTGPNTHRREGPAYVDWPPPSVDELIRNNLREAIIIFCSVVLGISWGIRELLWGTGTTPHRLAGLAVTFAALLLAASYLLRSFPALPRSHWWFRTRPRRMTRLVLTYTWIVFFFVLLVAGIVALIW